MMKRKMLTDSIFSIVASAIPIVILQLIILPIIASNLGDERYGLAITLISLAALFSLPFGNVLNNIRLLLNDTYKDNEIEGDFNILLLSGVSINSIIMVVGTVYYEGKISFISLILVVLFSALNLIREYLIVTFRITINYKGILINNLFLGMGYLVGLIAFLVFGYWQLIYLFGAIFSLLYISRRSSLLKENFTTTKFFKRTSYKGVVLFISVLMKSMITYADKLLLFPLLGPAAVSIYYSATLIGKIITMAITPVNSVMLSYLAKMKEMRLKNFLLVLFSVSIVGALGYIVIMFISEPILKFIYPKWANESLKLIPVTTATVIFGVISSVIHPVILRFNHINWQLVINFFNLIIYIICVFAFYNLYGLLGFAIGMLVASIIKLVIMILVFLYNYNK